MEHSLQEAATAATATALAYMESVEDELRASGYANDDLRLALVRILFVLYGDTSGLWPPNLVATSLERFTQSERSDLGAWLQ
ncbi:MAG: hypothetical protein ACPG77_10245, partial [Nannocystaceae bacterium]